MLISVKDHSFIVQFQHMQKERTTEGKSLNITFISSTNRQTTCRIYAFEEGKKTEELHCLAEGTASCHDKDNFVRDTGRRIALGRAIQVICTFDTPESYLFEDNSFKKEFWKSYASQTRKPGVQRKRKNRKQTVA